MSFWGALWGNSSAVDKVVDAAVATGDKLFFTEEEKHEGRLKLLEWSLRFREATKGSNLARRLIAVILTITYAAIILLAAAMILLEGPAPEGAATRAESLVDLLREVLNDPMNLVLIFYFAIDGVRAWKGGK